MAMNSFLSRFKCGAPALWLVCLTALWPWNAAQAHGLSPQRVYASEPGQILFVFLAMNMYNTAEFFDIEVFYQDFDSPIDFAALPLKFNLAGNSSRKFKVKFLAEQKGLYFVCTRQTAKPWGDANQVNVTSRICARIGVGVKPE